MAGTVKEKIDNRQAGYLKLDDVKVPDAASAGQKGTVWTGQW